MERKLTAEADQPMKEQKHERKSSSPVHNSLRETFSQTSQYPRTSSCQAPHECNDLHIQLTLPHLRLISRGWRESCRNRSAKRENLVVIYLLKYL